MFFTPGDTPGREQFLAAHDFRHRAYRQASARMGRPLAPYDLTGQMNADWFSRHMLAHAALRALFPAEIGNSTVSLEMPQQGEENDLSDWLRRHALEHARY